MKKNLMAMLMVLLAANSTVSAQDYARYYENLPMAMPQVNTPNIPARTVKLSDYGAVGVAQFPRAIERELRQMKAFGFNAVP